MSRPTVVEITDVDSPIGPKAQVGRAEPRVVGVQPGSIRRDGHGARLRPHVPGTGRVSQEVAAEKPPTKRIRQRVPTVDTSNPFSAREIPTQDESFVVVRFRREMKNVDFPYLLQMIDGSFMSRINTLVVPGGKMGLAMELILTPLIEDLMKRKKSRGYQMDWVQ